MSGPLTEDFECGSKAAADMIRREFADIVRDDEDDARTKTVTVSTSRPPSVEPDLHRIVNSSWEDEARPGQSPLTRHEKARLDFSRTNVFHARSCKAIAHEAGVDDWTAYYDYTLSVDEHREMYRRHGTHAGADMEMGISTDITMRDMDAVEAGFYG